MLTGDFHKKGNLSQDYFELQAQCGHPPPCPCILYINLITRCNIIDIFRYAADLAHFALQAAHLDLDADNSINFGERH